MKKMYVELQSTRTEMQQGFKRVNSRIDGLETKIGGLEKEVNKNSIKIESLENKVNIIAEVQLSHMNQNENSHV